MLLWDFTDSEFPGICYSIQLYSIQLSFSLFVITRFFFFCLFFKLSFNLEMIVDSNLVVKNSTERCCLYFTQFLSVATSCKSVVHCHNQNIDIDKIHLSYSDFCSFTCTHLCVCVFLLHIVHLCMHFHYA